VYAAPFNGYSAAAYYGMFMNGKGCAGKATG
jgi:hypothetical protein